jgi:hypothetical protein
LRHCHLTELNRKSWTPRHAGVTPGSNQFHRPGAAVVVTNIERKRKQGLSGLRFAQPS